MTYHEVEQEEDECPRCNKKTLVHGFGLCGGGYGPYSYCTDEACGYFEKTQIDE